MHHKHTQMSNCRLKIDIYESNTWKIQVPEIKWIIDVRVLRLKQALLSRKKWKYKIIWQNLIICIVSQCDQCLVRAQICKNTGRVRAHFFCKNTSIVRVKIQALTVKYLIFQKWQELSSLVAVLPIPGWAIWWSTRAFKVRTIIIWLIL